ncbi:AP-1-like transcription factor [Podospora australis]|uniref:AP-1-like transcription factor n=1 Tax=Podospora australis TaxID=1536484 RepID=A0AAN6WW32_9PEZI|nr:AP-1-like transcription factor [Podospora australis]
MASTMSPDQGTSQSSPGGASSSHDKSPLSSLNLGFLKSLTEKRSTTRDGQAPKRRGPKPDSKPALTRRQELNRQAQRTHRERKELYIKALEDEVLRLKEVFSNVSQDKERLADENRQLKALLTQNGLPGASSLLDESMSNHSIGFTSSASMVGSYVTPSSNTSNFTPSPLPASSTGHASGSLSPQAHPHLPRSGQPARDPNLDYEQAGIDFVLTLERPCMDHMPWLLERGTETGGHEPCGHALMASCPPEPFPDLTPDIPFGYTNVRVNGNRNGAGNVDAAASGQRTWELSKGDLATLLDLSKRLNLDGEITPVMAWGMVLAHPRLGELKLEDFRRLTDELSTKIRCYGYVFAVVVCCDHGLLTLCRFGAVMEEFEVRDALENIFSTKTEPGVRL